MKCYFSIFRRCLDWQWNVTHLFLIHNYLRRRRECSCKSRSFPRRTEQFLFPMWIASIPLLKSTTGIWIWSAKCERKRMSRLIDLIDFCLQVLWQLEVGRCVSQLHRKVQSARIAHGIRIGEFDLSFRQDFASWLRITVLSYRINMHTEFHLFELSRCIQTAEKLKAVTIYRSFIV